MHASFGGEVVVVASKDGLNPENEYECSFSGLGEVSKYVEYNLIKKRTFLGVGHDSPSPPHPHPSLGHCPWRGIACAMLVVVVVLCKVVRVTGHGYQVPVARGYPEGIDFARTSPRRDRACKTEG